MQLASEVGAFPLACACGPAASDANARERQTGAGGQWREALCGVGAESTLAARAPPKVAFGPRIFAVKGGMWPRGQQLWVMIHAPTFVSPNPTFFIRKLEITPL